MEQTDAISRSELIKQIRLMASRTSLGETRPDDISGIEVCGLILNAPALDVAPVVHEKDIRSSVITVKDSDEWQDRIILADESTQVCAVYYADDSELMPVVRCKDCKHWGMLEGPPETESVKCCEFGQYMVGANGYCVYGEVKNND